MKKLNELTAEEFVGLKKLGMLYEFYPDAPNQFEELCPKEEPLSKIKIRDCEESRQLLKEYCQSDLFAYSRKESPLAKYLEKMLKMILEDHLKANIVQIPWWPKGQVHKTEAFIPINIELTGTKNEQNNKNDTN